MLIKIILVLTLALPFFSRANVTYEDFVHLSPARKQALVLGMIKVLSSLENQFPKTIHTKKVVKFNLKLHNFLIASVHASEEAPARVWNDYKTEFLDAIKGHNDSFCIFGGWPSQTKEVEYPAFGKKKVCQSPSSLPKESKEYISYSKSQRCTGEKVACNPMVYGFKRAHSRTLFCVDTTNNNDVSKDCMNLSLGIKEDPSIGDPPDVRIKDMTKNFESMSKSEYEEIYGFIYKTCLCPGGKMHSGEPDSKIIDKSCESLLVAINETACEYQYHSSTVHEDTVRALREYFKKIRETSGDNQEQIYANLRATIQRSGKEFKALCEKKKEPENVKPDPSCSIDTKLSEDKKTIIADASVKSGEPVSYKWSESNSTEKTASYSSLKKIKIELEVKLDSDKEVRCDKVYNPVSPKLTTSITEKNWNKYTITAVISPKDSKLQIIWTFEDLAGQDVKQGWTESPTPKEPKPDIIYAGTPEEEPPQDAPGKDESPEKTKKKSVKKSSDLIITQSRAVKSYKVCASLENDTSSKSCQLIDKLEIDAPANLQPGAPPIRGSSDTSAVGIK